MYKKIVPTEEFILNCFCAFVQISELQGAVMVRNKYIQDLSESLQQRSVVCCFMFCEVSICYLDMHYTYTHFSIINRWKLRYMQSVYIQLSSIYEGGLKSSRPNN